MADEDMALQTDKEPGNPFPSVEDMEVAEEIVMGDEFEETDSVIIPRTTNYEYEQSNSFKGITYTFKIYNDFYLHRAMTSFRNKERTDTRINLTYVDTDPKRERIIEWNWLYVCLGCLVFGGLMIYLGEFAGLVLFDIAMEHPYMLPVGLVSVTLGLLFALVFVYRMSDKVHYYSHVGGVPLIEMLNQPRSTEFQEFRDKLYHHIEKAKKRQGLSMKQRLKMELSDLRRLSEEGAVSQEDYEEARGRILKHSAYN